MMGAGGYITPFLKKLRRYVVTPSFSIDALRRRSRRRGEVKIDCDQETSGHTIFSTAKTRTNKEQPACSLFVYFILTN
jgi:hypothetical protein